MKKLFTLFAIIFIIANFNRAFAQTTETALGFDSLFFQNDSSYINYINSGGVSPFDTTFTDTSQQTVPVVQPPTFVLNITPSKGGLNIDTSTIIEVTFNNPVNITTVTNSTFILAGEISGVHLSTFSFSQNNTVIKAVPAFPFKKGERVQVIVSNKIKDFNDQNIAPLVTQFTVSLNLTPAKFAQGVLYSVGERPLSVVVYDIDGDKDGDIIAANSSWQGTYTSNTISVLKNNGDGTFAPKVNYVTDYGANVCPIDVSVGDLDGDGDGDLVVANFYSQTISILRNDGSGIFGAPEIYSVGHAMRVKIYDIDGNGSMDIVVTCGGLAWWWESPSLYIYVLKNNGNGTFAAPVQYYVGLGQFGLDIYDLDGDGDGDIVAAIYRWNVIVVLFNNGDGTFGNTAYYNVGVYPAEVSVADFDGDGDGDITVANQSSSNICVFKNNGNGIFSDRKDYATYGQPVGVFVSDVDCDGDEDIITANHYQPGNTISVWKNRGDGLFEKRDDFVTNGSNTIDVYAADLDNDGDIDISTANWGGNSVSVLKNAVPGLSGVVFNDENGNGVQDSAEFGISNWLLQLDGGLQTLYATTNNRGEYYFITDPGTYTLKQIIKTGYQQTYPVGDQNILIPSDTKELKNINFGNQYLLDPEPDLTVSIVGQLLAGHDPCFSEISDPSTGFCPNPCGECALKQYTVYFANIGTGMGNNQICTLSVQLPPGVMYDAAQVMAMQCPPDNIIPDIFLGFTFEWYHLCEAGDNEPDPYDCPSIHDAGSAWPPPDLMALT